MAILFVEGFDIYQNTYSGGTLTSGLAPTTGRWTGYVQGSAPAGGFGVSPVYARGTGNGCRILDSGGRALYKTLPSAQATLVTGAAMNFQALPVSSSPILAFYDSTSGAPVLVTQCDVRGDGAGHLTVTRNGTVLATSSNTVSTGVWYYIEFKATIHNTTGVIELRVNSTSTGWVPSTGSLNTRGQSTNNSADIVAMGGATDTYCDDFYVCDTTGSINTTFTGPMRVAPLVPAAAGNYAQWTPNGGANFANVADLPLPDGDTTVNQSSTAGQLDSYVCDDVPATSGTVFAVQSNIYARQDAGAQRVIARLIRRASTDYVGTSQNTAGSYTYFLQVDETDPNTSAQWTIANVNAAEFGIKLIS